MASCPLAHYLSKPWGGGGAGGGGGAYKNRAGLPPRVQKPRSWNTETMQYLFHPVIDIYTISCKALLRYQRTHGSSSTGSNSYTKPCLAYAMDQCSVCFGHLHVHQCKQLCNIHLPMINNASALLQTLIHVSHSSFFVRGECKFWLIALVPVQLMWAPKPIMPRYQCRLSCSQGL